MSCVQRIRASCVQLVRNTSVFRPTNIRHQTAYPSTRRPDNDINRTIRRSSSKNHLPIVVAASDSVIEVDIAVDGMVCDGCTSRVEEGLEQMDIVETAKADLEGKKVTVALTAESFGEAAQQLERIVEAVNDMGFEAKPNL